LLNHINKNNDTIDNLEAKLNLIILLIPFLENIPNPYQYKEIDIMRITFARYSLRTIFFLKKYNEELLKIYEMIIEKNGFKKKLRFRINNDIYYYFDSSIVFFKSITEYDKRKEKEKENLIKPSLFTNKKVRSILIEKMILWKKELDKISLDYLRNEIVHLNNSGISLDSWILTTGNEKKDFKILQILYNNNELDLNEYFNNTFHLITNIIDKLLGLIFSEYILLYGSKPTEKYYTIENKKIKISDFKLYL